MNFKRLSGNDNNELGVNGQLSTIIEDAFDLLENGKLFDFYAPEGLSEIFRLGIRISL